MKRVRRINLHSPYGHGQWRQAGRWIEWHLARVVRTGFNLLHAGTLLEPRGIEARREVVSIANLLPALEGLRIAHLSDFHCGAFMSAHAMRGILRQVWDERPDLLALTGDYVEFHPADMHQLIVPLRELPAPPLGIFAVLGNHDFMHGNVKAIIEGLRQGGVHCLRNDAVRVQREGAGLWLAGIEDHWRGKADFEHILRAIQTDEPRILLCHNPDVVGHARDHNFRLQLSGHTHGGQWVLPWYGPARVYSVNGPEFIGGTIEVGGTLLHVSRGVGMASLPLRISCPAEFTMLELRKAPANTE